MIGVGADAEKFKKIHEFSPPDHRQLQFQQRILAEIHVHRVNLRRAIQQIIERIAARAGDHHDAALASSFISCRSMRGSSQQVL